MLKNDFENQNFEIFAKVDYTFGKSDDVIISWKKAYFPLDTCVISFPT